MVGVVTAVTSAITGAVVSVVYSSSSSPQEIMVKLIRNMKRIMSICLIGFLIGYFRRTLHIPKIGGFNKNVGG